jgi:hypothetical protein
MRRVSAGLALLLLLAAQPVTAHDIPFDVTVQAFVRPAGHRLQLLVRAPLAAMRDLDYPTAGPFSQALLDLSRSERVLRDAATLWLRDNIAMYEGETRLDPPAVVAVRASIAGDKSFSSFDAAIAHVMGPRLPDDMEFVWNQGLLDVLFEYPIEPDASAFSIHPAFARLGVRVVTVLRFLPPGGAVRAFELPGDPGLVHLDPSWRQAALSFVEHGFFHILDGTDHLLFLFCLVIPLRRLRALIPVVTAFTVAHSITLIGSAYGYAPETLWFPPLVETLIATSIVFMALENIVAYSSSGSPQLRRRWLIAFAFGLVHGFGFSFALRQTMQFAGAHLLTSLLAFNVGVELGQILVLVLVIPILELLFRFGVAERVGAIILSALIAHTGWHWMGERLETLRKYPIEWPALTPMLMLTAVRWAIVVVAAAAAVWVVYLVLDAVQMQPRRREVSKKTN